MNNLDNYSCDELDDVTPLLHFEENATRLELYNQ